jgi:hypothetical protein
MPENRPVSDPLPYGSYPERWDLIYGAARIITGLRAKGELSSENERRLVTALQLLTEVCGELLDELDTMKTAIRLLGGINVDELRDALLTGVVAEGLDAIGERSGFGEPGGFRRHVLDRLEALERECGDVSGFNR